MGIKFSSKRPLTQEEEAEIQKMIASDPDAPEATDEQLAKAKPFKEAFPDMAAKMEKAIRGGRASTIPRRRLLSGSIRM